MCCQHRWQIEISYGTSLCPIIALKYCNKSFQKIIYLKIYLCCLYAYKGNMDTIFGKQRRTREKFCLGQFAFALVEFVSFLKKCTV